MKIVADENIPLVAEALGEIGDVSTLPVARITNAAVRDAELLVIRNETAVNLELLRGSRVRMVLSATTGTDHVDFPLLESQGIAFANAPGSNANSVKEYAVAALLSFSARHGVSLQGKTIGIIGAGNIGSRLAAACRALSMTVLENDPPLARATGERRFVPMDEVLQADFISLHVPLTLSGSDATYHLLPHDRFARMKKGVVIVNTARGPVIETSALVTAIRKGIVHAALIDVWENEPAIDPELLSLTDLGTAHVAGYSMEGRLAAVRMVLEAARSHFGLASTWDASSHLVPVERTIVFAELHCEFETAMHRIVRQVYDVEHDSAQLKEMLSRPPQERVPYYCELRTAYPLRREFSSHSVSLAPQAASLARPLSELGFICKAEAANRRK